MDFLRKICSKVIGFLKEALYQIQVRINRNKSWVKLTVLPGIGMKNAQIFFEAGYRTPQQILQASDEALLAIPGVGRIFLKRLRSFK